MAGRSMTNPISMRAIDLAKGSFQVCAIGPDGALPRTTAWCRGPFWPCSLRTKRPAWWRWNSVPACIAGAAWRRYGHDLRLAPAHGDPFRQAAEWGGEDNAPVNGFLAARLG